MLACAAGGNLSAPERSDLPSPRTRWSVKGSKPLHRLWCRLHKRLAREASEWEAHQGARWRLMLLGDSITESWRGTELGNRPSRARGVPRVLKETFAAWPKPLVLGIAGDQTQRAGPLSP